MKIDSLLKTPYSWTEGSHGYHCNPFKTCGLCDKNGGYGLSGKLFYLIRAIKGEPMPTTRSVYRENR